MSQWSESKRPTNDELSALMDGELDASAVGRACGQWRDDEETRANWHAYHLIGDVLRSDDLVSDYRLAATYRARLRAEGSDDAERHARMDRVNPKYVLRNHLAETAIRKARGDEGARDFSELARLLSVLERPYDEQPGFEAYAAEPPDWARSLELSCSS